MTRVVRSDSVVWAWVICLTALLTFLGIIAALGDRPTPFEEEAHAELATLDLGSPTARRVVVLGNSLTRHVTAYSPTFEDQLRNRGFDVHVANLAGVGRWYDSYIRLQDDVLAAQPDVIVLQVDVLGDSGRISEASLAYRTRFLLRGDERIRPYLTSRCRSGPDLDQTAEGVLRALPLPPAGLEWAEDLVQAANDQGTAVYLLSVPRSQALRDEVGPILDAFHSETIRTLESFDNVAASPVIEITDPGLFCDLTHLNEEGQAVFLDEIVPDFSAFLDSLDPA